MVLSHSKIEQIRGTRARLKLEKEIYESRAFFFGSLVKFKPEEILSLRNRESLMLSFSPCSTLSQSFP